MDRSNGWKQLLLERHAGLWAKVEKSPPGVEGPTNWTFPPGLSDFTYVQSFREDLSDTSYGALDRVGRDLEQSRGQAYEGVLRTGDGSRISPPWLHVEDGMVDAVSGRVVLAARINHQACGLSPAYESGSVGTRNVENFVRAGHPRGLFWPNVQLYVGSTRTGVVGPVDFRHDVHAVDYHDGRQLIAVLTHLGSSTGAVFVVEATGEWRVLTSIEDLTGGFTPFGFSPDGAWLLVSHHDHVTLVEVDSGRHLAVPLPGGYWWPGSPSGLVGLRNTPQGSHLETFDLSSNTVTGRSEALVMDRPLDQGLVMAFNPMPSADGRRLLVSTHAGMPRDYQQKHGSGARIAAVEVATGRGAVLGDIVLDERLGLERRCTAARWVTRIPSTGAVELHPELAAQLTPPTVEHEWLVEDRWSDEAEGMLILTLNSAIDDFQAGRYFGALLPEVVGSLACLATNPTQWDGQREWLSGVHDYVVTRMSNATMAPADAVLWAQFADAFEDVAAGRAKDVDLLSLSWLREPASTRGLLEQLDWGQPESPVNPYAQAFPTATGPQLETVQAIWERLHSVKEEGSELTPRQIAAISELIDRLIRENPDLDAFAERVKDFAREAQQSGLPHSVQFQWRWFLNNL